jgi:tetratricopeptide (TPR) repeat protein
MMAILVAGLSLLTGCSSVRSFFALDSAKGGSNGRIHNPFGDFNSAQGEQRDALILRTKKGDRSVEIELPRSAQQMTEFTIPVSPAFKESSTGGSREIASVTPTGPSAADREITRQFPQSLPGGEASRRQIEQGLGLSAVEADDSRPEATGSYLASMDQLRLLYKNGRFEVALLQTDTLLRQYPTDPRLYQMRGTLLDRVGQPELALQAWRQALRLSPQNEGLKRFIQRREERRGVASTPKEESPQP